MSTPDKVQPDEAEKPGRVKVPLRAFSRELRLLNASDFSRVFSAAVKASDRFFTVLARPSPETVTRSRLGLAIAKKQLRHAVDRNRVKRLLREFFRLHVAGRSGPAVDYVVMARHAVRQENNRQLRQSLQQLFEQIQEKAGGRNDTDRPVP